MKAIGNFLLSLPKKIVRSPFLIISLCKIFYRSFLQISSFSILLIAYLLHRLFSKIGEWKIFSPIKLLLGPLLNKVYKFIVFHSRNKEDSINRVNLIELALRNMSYKKTRSLITIGGMAVGIGSIVFLVSIGYGLQELVVSRVARLDEMKQADVYPQPGSKVKLNDETIAKLHEVPNVELVLPLIAVVGRVNFQNSVSDMAVYGVTADFLKQSAIKPVQGKIFDSNEIAMEVPKTVGEVAGVSIEKIADPQELGDKIQDIEFTINPQEWIRVRESPNTNAKVLGYTRRLEGQQRGAEYLGSTYVDQESGKYRKTEDGKWLGKWVKSPVLLWKKEKCKAEDGDCEDKEYKVMRNDDNSQTQADAYFAEVAISVVGSTIKEAQVLGVTSTDDPGASASGDFVEIASESAVVKIAEPKTVDLAQTAKKEAVVNRAMLKILGINEDQAVNKTFSTSFVAIGELFNDSGAKVQSTETEYKIVGVVADEKTPYFYVPFTDLRALGVDNYSQIKMVVKSPSDLPIARKQVEALGYMTRSVSDTVAQINTLFGTARTVMALLGMVALGVAALGMFNTLTVSLLERTREVGLMKAMGMKAAEVHELFLTESMMMGFFGGLLGLLLGFVGGKIAGLFISIFSVAQGAGFIDIAYIPFGFVFLIIFLSFVVGIGTGVYPARRATKISALNALRYE